MLRKRAVGEVSPILRSRLANGKPLARLRPACQFSVSARLNCIRSSAVAKTVACSDQYSCSASTRLLLL